MAQYFDISTFICTVLTSAKLLTNYSSVHDMIDSIKKLCETNQCRRKACRNADKPSMISRMATVSPANAAKIMERPKNPPLLRENSPRCITMDQSTSDSSAINSNSN